MKIIFYCAVTGWIVSVIVHILSIANIDVSDKLPFIWLLHLGIFAVWIPTVLFLRGNKELAELKKTTTLKKSMSFSSLKIIFKDTPEFMTLLAKAGFVYAIVSFLYLIITSSGTPGIRDGQFILHNHGQLIKILTEQEYRHYKANETRLFSGHWIAFYGVAAAVLYNSFTTQVKSQASNE